MKELWKFPALVRGVAPNPKEERMCLVQGEAEFELREVDIRHMPVAVEAEFHYGELGEYRLFEGNLYRSWDEDDVVEVERESGDIMSAGRSGFYQPLTNEIVDILRSGTVAAWPKDAFRNPERGARALDKSGVKLLPEGHADLEKWRMKFADRMAEHVVSNGRLWVRTAEPLYLVDMTKGQLIVYEASLYRDKRDELGKPNGIGSGGKGADYRVFSLLEREQAVEAATAAALLLGQEPEILDMADIRLPEALTLDVDRLEFDRMARVAVAHVTAGLARTKPGGGQTILDVAPTSLVREWMELKDFLRGYDPLVGVPNELETVFGAFVSEIDGFSGVYGPSVMSSRTREAVADAWSRWDNRTVDISPAMTFASAG